MWQKEKTSCSAKFHDFVKEEEMCLIETMVTLVILCKMWDVSKNIGFSVKAENISYHRSGLHINGI